MTCQTRVYVFLIAQNGLLPKKIDLRSHLEAIYSFAFFANALIIMKTVLNKAMIVLKYDYPSMVTQKHEHIL